MITFSLVYAYDLSYDVFLLLSRDGIGDAAIGHTQRQHENGNSHRTYISTRGEVLRSYRPSELVYMLQTAHFT